MRRAPTLDFDAVLAGLLVGEPIPGEEAGDPGAAGDDPINAALLDATSALLAEHGTRGWTVDDVALRAGVGRATVYRRFPSRDDLMRAAITRDARRFFAAIADSVRSVETLEDKVVHGFVAGLRLARVSPLSSLLRADPAAAMYLLGSESLLRTAALALTERYEALTGTRLDRSARAQVEVSAEALVRLGISFVLIPGQTADLDDRRARDHLASIIRPLLGSRS
ncbi:MAG TPA: helix-turn-helix domain-containing protein [Acidimicrobiales bacterium]|nr:helix-turn-helix domain-containing protein [Acidimicrobiales bacterium]